ncbi:hypothetical protein CVH13_00117 [Dehalococcoides mccartyi]|uniref:HNH domain-containing protein n=1 Tax=Dehalococcoides mccartyi TaxID=61435 RepID=A0A2J1E0F0_9CHLR|nr:hypothetical protein CVH13_00117 [Dehalococcoides mccartyi]
MVNYWFVTQDPKVLEYKPPGLWVLNRFRKSMNKLHIKIGDWVAVYEPIHDRDKIQSNGSSAIVALARITNTFSSWQPDGDFWKVAESELVYKNDVGIPAAIAVKILANDKSITGRRIGLFLNRNYSGRITNIGPKKFYTIANYFVSDESETDEDYQSRIEMATALENPTSIPSEPRYIESKGRKILTTDPSLGKFCLERANFKCELDINHTSFISKITSKSYVELHHLIPLKAQINFKSKLDNSANIVALCPNCHRLLHHAIETTKKDSLRTLLDNRTSELIKCGTPIVFDELLQYY